MQIKPYNKVVKKSLVEINEYQKGERLIINTGKSWYDGLITGNIITIGGGSFVGKTIELNELRDNIMNKEYNVFADEFIWLSNSLEMTQLMNTLNDLTRLLNVSKKEILTTKFNEVQKLRVKTYYESKQDGRFFLNEESGTPQDFEAMIIPFLEEYKNKKAIFIDIDHVRFFKDSSKKGAIDSVLEMQNDWKRAYPNVIFINIFQFNRESFNRIEEKSERMRAQRNDFADTDVGFTVSDFVVALSSPFQLGVENYRLVSPTYYEYLSEHFGEFNNKGNKVSLKTYGRIFVEVLKGRFADGYNSKNLFVKVIEEDNRPDETSFSFNINKNNAPNFKELYTNENNLLPF